MTATKECIAACVSSAHLLSKWSQTSNLKTQSQAMMTPLKVKVSYHNPYFPISLVTISEDEEEEAKVPTPHAEEAKTEASQPHIPSPKFESRNDTIYYDLECK